MDELKKLFQAKRILAMMLAAAMVITMLPTTANAASVSANAAGHADLTQADSAQTDSLQTDQAGQVSYRLEDNRSEDQKYATYDEDIASEEYSGYGKYSNYFDDALEWILIIQEEEGVELNRTSVKDVLDNPGVSNYKDYTIEWQIKKGEEETAEFQALPAGSRPAQAGEYQLVVTFPDKTTATVDFTVNPLATYAEVNLKKITPGTTQSAVTAESLIQSLYFYTDASGDWGVNFTTDLDGLGLDTPYPALVTVGKIQIINIGTGDIVADPTAELKKNEDYSVEITFAYNESATNVTRTNYKLPEPVSKLVTIGNLVVPKVVVDLGKKPQVGADGKPEVDANGQPVMVDRTELEYVYTGEAVTEPVRGTDYTVKVELEEQAVGADGQPVTDADGKPVHKEITIPEEDFDKSFEFSWCDEYGYELPSEPKAAGNYIYRITYKGQAGLYAEAYEDIPVVVKEVELTIVPTFTEGAAFYPGMTVKQALAQIDYTVLDADKQSFDAKVDRNSFWGTRTSNNATIPYEPVFAIEKKTGTTSEITDDGTEVSVDTYRSLSNSDILESGETYRVIFTGQKAVYSGNGNAVAKQSINGTADSFNPSYHVADEKEAREETAAAIKLEAGTEAVITDNLPGKDGKGDSYENPITKVYSGEGIFTKRAEYKVATVTAAGKTIAEKTNKAITYTWERQDGTEDAVDSEGNVVLDKDNNPVKVPAWVDYDYNKNSLSGLVSPVNAGKYRLTISYADGNNDKDKRGGYYAKPVEVYYEIQPQNVIIVPEAPEGGYSTYVGYTADQVLNSFYNSGNLDLTGELAHGVYKYLEAENELGEQLNWLSGIIDAGTGEGIYFWHPYYVAWGIFKETENGWKMLNNSDVLESGGTYALMADYWDFDDESASPSYANNYRTYIEAGKDENGNQLGIYSSWGVPISLTTQGTVSLGIELNTSDITVKTTKEYDGNPIGILEEVKKNLKIYKLDDPNKTSVADEVMKDIGFVWKSRNGAISTEEPIDAGTYTLYAKFTGNASYKAFDSSDFCLNTGLTVTITPRELTVIPSLKTLIVAGGYRPYQYYDWAGTKFENYAECDKELFSYSSAGGFPAVLWQYPNSISVYDKNGNTVDANEKLKGNTEYTFEFAGVRLRDAYNNNYTLKYEKVPFTTERGYSSVAGTSASSIRSYEVSDVLGKDDKGTKTHTITANESIDYVYDVYNSVTGKYEDGNFIALRITMPEEYDDFSDAEAVYANSIEKAGGRVLRKSSNFINVLFNAEDGKETPIEFDIRWEEGYAEHFILDFTKADLLEDLENAVAPKTISLVSPSKKMTVGSTQQLDVKLTTSQIGDLVHLSYDVDNKNVLCVTDSGYVTALSEGDATVTIESTRRGEDGEYVSTTPVKKASVKIKVSKVSAPKIKKIDNILDGQARVSWTELANNDGYRREIYVLEGKTNYTKDEFERKISSMKNGNWNDIFAIAPIYGGTGKDSKAKLEYRTVSGLKPDTEYTVYVRNVNVVRSITWCGHDNCKVAESHDGSVKGFKTTKGQVKGLRVEFDDELSYVDFDEGYSYNMIPLSEGTTTVTVSGIFSEWVNDAGDSGWKTLPLSKEDQKEFVNPKLVYMVGELEELEVYDKEKDGYIGSISYYDEYGDYYESHWYLNKTTKASIDKKGKLKLNGVGRVDVVVKDSTTGMWASDSIEITAVADGVANKSVKMQVGQKIWLGNLLTYKEGNKVLTGDYARKIVVNDILRKAIEDNGCFKLSDDENYLIAVKAGKLTVDLEDAYVGKTAKATLTATALEPAKNLKPAVVTDQHFDVEFTHSLNPDEVGYKENLLYTEGLGFRIKVTDARGTLLRSAYVKAEDCNYNPITKKYHYRMTGLKKKSKYNVSITAEFGSEVSKEAKKPITTTLLPASYISLDKDEEGGVDIYSHHSYTTIDEETFYTGNSYTLEVGGDYFNYGAKAAMTDTLTWTSSNSKVATVKANAGSYSASLKATGQGTTIIEVKSKVTKAVIARYEIKVYAVGDAYSYRFDPYFFGDDESLDRNPVPSVMSYALKNGAATLCQQ